MDKRRNELAVVLRELAARRDARLQERPIAPARLERLREIVEAEFPLETAFGDTRPHRDAKLLARFGHALRSWQAIGAATAILLLSGVLVFETQQVANPQERISPVASPELGYAQVPQPRWRADRFLTGPGSRLALQVSSRELVQLRMSLPATNHAFSPALSDAKLNLRLDLPVSQILDDVGRGEMP